MSADKAYPFSLEGKTALIAGGSRGIGEEIARVFSLAGARLVISSRRAEGIEAAAERIRRATGGQVLAAASSITSEKDRRDLVDRAMAWAGRIDVLVNNAGSNPASGPLAEVDESAWDKIFDINLKGPFMLSRLVYHACMKDHGGCIINTASVAGFQAGGSLASAYAVTKAALIHLTKCLASEWGKDGVRVNALAPGLIKTRLSQALWQGPAGVQRPATTPIARLGVVEDLGGAALLLASEAGGFITGHTLVVDGGALVR
jgi:NAD(P)-dependent dehydrogenase (short-subunit alcohol dehydrogenase family)